MFCDAKLSICAIAFVEEIEFNATDGDRSKTMMEPDKKGSETARAAWLYYNENLTQSEVAHELNVSRSTVTRLLKRAEIEGLVHISLNVTAHIFKAERDLERAYGLEKARIVPDTNDDVTQKRWLCHRAAELMVGMVAEDSIVAVSWGSTMQSMADSLVGQHPIAAKQIVALNGGLHNASQGTNTYDVANQFGRYFNAPARVLLAPVYVKDEATAMGLASDPGIHDALELARKASIVIYSLGAMHGEATMFKLRHITSEQEGFLRERGAVGEIACRWIDRNGKPVQLPSSINPIGISLDDLKKIPQRMAIAGGELKQEVVLAALRGGFITTLITDERAAAYLLENH